MTNYKKKHFLLKIINKALLYANAIIIYNHYNSIYVIIYRNNKTGLFCSISYDTPLKFCINNIDVRTNSMNIILKYIDTAYNIIK